MQSNDSWPKSSGNLPCEDPSEDPTTDVYRSYVLQTRKVKLDVRTRYRIFSRRTRVASTYLSVTIGRQED